MNLIPNVPAKVFSFSAVIVGYLLIDDLTANEQNALGNWLMLVAQVLSTNAYYKQVQTDRGLNQENQKTPSSEETIAMMQKMMQAMQQEIENIKKNL